MIAEAGANHDRDLDVARRLIDVAAEAGADAVKFQTYSGRTLYSTKTPRFDYLGELGAKPAHELLDDLALPREWQPILAAHCRDAGIEFLSSPFDRAAVDELDALDVAAFKIASFELVDLPLIEYTASKGPPADPVDGHGVARGDRRRGLDRAPGRVRPVCACSSARRCTRRPRTS